MAGISALADHSLLRRQHGSEDEPRYLMLETVREYGLEQLTAHGEEAQARRAHADWMIERFEESWTAIIDRLELVWLIRVDADRDNLRAALSWLETTGDGEGLLRLAGAAGPLWMFHSYRSEGRRWLERALDLTRAARRAGDRAHPGAAGGGHVRAEPG